jgi:hypothetical protein
VPGENGYGEVMVVSGTGDADLLTADDRQTWSQGSAGVLGSASAGDEFGESLAAGDFDGTRRMDLAIGVTDEGVDGVTKAGAVNVLYSAGTLGLVSTGNQLWTQDVSGMAQFFPGGSHDVTSTGEQDFSPYTTGLAPGLNYVGYFGAGVA